MHLSTLLLAALERQPRPLATGERAEFAVHVDGVRGFDSRYGRSYLVRMHDADGNILVWWTSNPTLQEGTDVTIRATVKAHDWYNDDPQTVLLRVQPVKAA